MTAKLIAAAFATALLASTSAFAGETYGRDSVYAKPGTTSTKVTATTAAPRFGRSSVYVGDVATPSTTGTTKSTVAHDIELKPGRA